MDCVNNFFKLPQNNKLMVHVIEEMIFTAAAGMKCSDEDKAFQKQFDQYVSISKRVNMSCIKWHLYQVEPTSKLAENVEMGEAELKEYKKITADDLVSMQESLERKLGPLKAYTCKAVSENGGKDFFKFFCKGVLIKYGDISEELKRSEKEKLKKYFKDISIRTVNCIINRFEDDPEAYLANNTLNFYYKEASILTKPELFDVTGYYKRLIKVEDAIDYNCVKEKLNLSQIGDKVLAEVEAQILIASAMSKCIKVDPLEFSNLFIDFVYDDGDLVDLYFICAKLKLQKLEPTSKLAVTSRKDESYKDRCDYYDVSFQPYSVPTWTYKEQIGRMNETTCGVISDDFEDLITVKTMLLYKEENKELRINETKKLFDLITEKLEKLSDCILERIK